MKGVTLDILLLLDFVQNIEVGWTLE